MFCVEIIENQPCVSVGVTYRVRGGQAVLVAQLPGLQWGSKMENNYRESSLEN